MAKRLSPSTSIRLSAPYGGQNSFNGSADGRETFDASLYLGLRLWKGAELWIYPEIDQGSGFGQTHGAASFLSAEAYKFGADYPYARVQKAFLRQTIDLGGESQKVDADITQFAGSQTESRLVLTIGRFAIVDIFDTNKYANNPKTDFLNWSLINAGTFDYAGDAWGYSYGAAAEWYHANGPFAPACSTCQQCPPAVRVRSPTATPSTTSSWSARSSGATSCSSSRARSR